MPKGTFEELKVGEETARLYVTGEGAADRPRVVVFHAWWGLHDDVLAYADRLVDQGFAVLAPDLVRCRRASTAEEAEALVNERDEDHADAVALAAIDRAGGPCATIGFSFGVAWAIWCGAKRPDVVQATVVYYGTLEGPAVSKGQAPVLGHFAETDPFECDESIAKFDATLREAGRAVEVHRYPGTGHWFAEPSRDAYREAASEKAFERSVAFLRKFATAGRPVSSTSD